MKQEVLLHLVAEPRFQSIEVFCGDVEFNAVSAELDFVNALMETVEKRNPIVDRNLLNYLQHL